MNRGDLTSSTWRVPALPIFSRAAIVRTTETRSTAMGIDEMEARSKRGFSQTAREPGPKQAIA
jgi:hypothetical protein